MRKVKVASLDLHIFTTYFKITEWQRVTPALFQVNACSRFEETATVYQGELQLFFEQQPCVPRAKQSVWSWRQMSSQMSSGRSLPALHLQQHCELCSGGVQFSTRTTTPTNSSIGSWQQLPPEEALSFCPSAGLAGKDLQGHAIDKSSLAVATTIPLLRASVGHEPCLAWGGFPGGR